MIERFLEQEKAISCVLGSDVKSRHLMPSLNILGYLVDKYSDPVKDELLDMASLMDPRFRTSYIDPDKVEKVRRRAVSELLSFPADKSTPQPGPVVQVDQEEARPQPDPKRKKTLATFFKKSVVVPTSD
ncbi:hypothetical protein cypCar_00044137, partial [Cyprinus carpio]